SLQFTTTSASSPRALRHNFLSFPSSSTVSSLEVEIFTSNSFAELCITLYSVISGQTLANSLNTYTKRVSPATFLPDGSIAISSILPINLLSTSSPLSISIAAISPISERINGVPLLNRGVSTTRPTVPCGQGLSFSSSISTYISSCASFHLPSQPKPICPASEAPYSL